MRTHGLTPPGRERSAPGCAYVLATVAGMPLWVSVLNISDRTAEKVTSVHHIEVGELRDAIVCVSGLSYTWDDDSERGTRALVQVTIRGREALVALYPGEDAFGDCYNLGSVYFV